MLQRAGAMADGPGLTERFERAAERMRLNSGLKLTNEDKLELYSLFKQANEGDCTTDRPAGWFDFTGKAKWDAWNANTGMTKTDAMGKYIDVVTRLDPEWETSTLDPGSKGKKRDVSSDSVGHAVSTLAGRDVEEAISDDKKTLFDWCKEGNHRRLRSLVTEANVNQTDQEGMSLLHWACDRGNLEVVQLLVEKGANVNIQDNDKQTPLHYAASCDHKFVVTYLVSTAKARTDIADCDGNLPQDVTENTTTRQLFN